MLILLQYTCAVHKYIVSKRLQSIICTNVALKENGFNLPLWKAKWMVLFVTKSWKYIIREEHIRNKVHEPTFKEKKRAKEIYCLCGDLVLECGNVVKKMHQYEDTVTKCWGTHCGMYRHFCYINSIWGIHFFTSYNNFMYIIFFIECINGKHPLSIHCIKLKDWNISSMIFHVYNKLFF